MNMGPNSTTFALPAILFPTRLRATAGGFAAACAKAGATLGTFFLPDLRAAYGTDRHAPRPGGRGGARDGGHATFRPVPSNSTRRSSMA